MIEDKYLIQMLRGISGWSLSEIAEKIGGHQSNLSNLVKNGQPNLGKASRKLATQELHQIIQEKLDEVLDEKHTEEIVYIYSQLLVWNSISSAFWTVFDGIYPPKNWDEGIEKFPEKYQKALNDCGVDLSIDASFEGEWIYPAGLWDTDISQEIRDAAEEEDLEEQISQFNWNIARVVQEKVEGHPDWPFFQRAVQLWYIVEYQ
jgi:predicted DNA-binding protein YlxM (UPF0122 family)